MIDYEAFRAAPLAREPYPHFAIPDFLPKDEVAKAIADFPKIDMGGLFLPEFAPYGPAFDKLLKELEGPDVRRIVEEKFDIDLAGRPTMVTLRSNCQAKDGRIHADAKFKLATLLLYLNEDWVDQGGKLRVLRSGSTSRTTPARSRHLAGSPCFQGAGHSWHGHKPFVGPRRYVMLNYCTDQQSRDQEVAVTACPTG